MLDSFLIQTNLFISFQSLASPIMDMFFKVASDGQEKGLAMTKGMQSALNFKNFLGGGDEKSPKNTDIGNLLGGGEKSPKDTKNEKMKETSKEKQ